MEGMSTEQAQTNLSWGNCSGTWHQVGAENADPLTISLLACPRGLIKGERVGESFANLTQHTSTRDPRPSLWWTNLAGVDARAGERRNVLELPPQTPQFSGPRLQGVSRIKVSCKEPPEVILARKPLCFSNSRGAQGQ